MQTFGMVSLLASSSAVIGWPLLLLRPIFKPASIQSFLSAEKEDLVVAQDP